MKTYLNWLTENNFSEKKRFIYETPETGEKKQPQAPQNREKILDPKETESTIREKADAAKRNPEIADAAKQLEKKQDGEKTQLAENTKTKKTEIAETKQKEREKLKTEIEGAPEKPYSQTYLETLTGKEDLSALEQLRQKTESDEVSQSQIQGGWEWLGLKEENQLQKYTLLSQAYLKAEQDPKTKTTTLTVRDELDRSYKTKFGIGAGDLLPPAATEVEITDDKGNKIIGTRGIQNDRIGYYDKNGKYLPIFAGYKLEIRKTLDEKSDEYKKRIEAEKQIVLDRMEAERNFMTGTNGTPDEVMNYERGGDVSYPVASTTQLRTANSDSLSGNFSEDTREFEVGRIEKGKKDLQKTEALLNKFGIRTDVRSEADGGILYLGFGGEAAKMLGWDEKMETAKNDLLGKTKDEKLIQETLKDMEDGKEKAFAVEGITIAKDSKDPRGYFFKETKFNKKFENDDALEKFIIEKIAPQAQPSKTAQFIKTLQNGGTWNDIRLSGGYAFDVAHLRELNRLSENDPEVWKDIKEKLGNSGRAISSKEFIQIMSERKLTTKGLSKDEAFREAQRLGLGEIMGNGELSLERIVNMSRSKTAYSIDGDYRFNALQQYRDYPAGGGKHCCAFTASTFLGLGEDGASTRGKEGRASGILAKTVRSNMEKSGNAGFVIGFENMQRGDLIGFKGGPNYGQGKIAHVAIVRDRFKIDGEEYLAIQHDQADIQVNLVPVNRRSSKVNHLQKALANPSVRAEYMKKYPQLGEIYNFRRGNEDTVQVRKNAGWYGDKSKGSGNILFGVRTAGLVRQ